jgi:hypothetical protein
MARRARVYGRLLFKVAIVFAVVKILANIFSTHSNPAVALKDKTTLARQDLAAGLTVGYAITLTRVPEGLPGRTLLDAVEVR